MEHRFLANGFQPIYQSLLKILIQLLFPITESMYKNKGITLIFTQLLKAGDEDQKLYELTEFVELFSSFL